MDCIANVWDILMSGHILAAGRRLSSVFEVNPDTLARRGVCGGCVLALTDEPLSPLTSLLSRFSGFTVLVVD